MAREFHGKIPKVPIDADTSKADEKIDRLFQRIKQVEHIEIDANVSQAQRRLETMIKRTNKQMSSDLVNTMLKDFKTVLGAMKTEFQNMGESDIFKGLEKTCNMVEERFSNLTVSIDKKSVSGLENILNTAKELKSISDFSFGDVVSKQTVKNTKTVLSDVRATKKEINSIVNKIDYIQKTLDKSEKSALSTDKLGQYEKKLKSFGDSLKGFYDIEDELIQNALVNATSKINKAMGDIKIRMPKVKVTDNVSSDKDTLKSLIASEKKAKAIQEVTSRISTNSSIKGLKNLHQEAVNVTEVLGKMYDEGIRDTERYITLQYKLQKIFDKLGKGYGGVRGSGAKNSSELLDFVIDGIQQRTGVNLFSSSGFVGVMENLFGDADFSLFNKSLSKLGMKDVAELLLITGKTGDWVDMQKQVAVEVEKTAEVQDVVSSTQNNIIKSKKEELNLTKQIGKEEAKNATIKANVMSGTIKTYNELKSVLEECENLASQMVKYEKPEIITLVDSGFYKPIVSDYLVDETKYVSLITDAWNEYKKLEATVDSTNESLEIAKKKVIALAVSYARSHKDLSAFNNADLEAFTSVQLNEYSKAKRDEEFNWGMHGKNTKKNAELTNQIRLLRESLLYGKKGSQVFADGIHLQLLEHFNQVAMRGTKANDVLDETARLMGIEIPVTTENATAAIEAQTKATEKLAEANKKLNNSEVDAAVDKAQLEKKVKELKYMVSNQEAWLKYLDGSLDKEKFKTSGKKEATERLRTLTQWLVSHRRDNYEYYNGQFPEEMVNVAWMHGYEEAKKQGVAQSTLDRYRVSDVEIFYKANLATLQEEYDRRQEVLNKNTEELRIIEAQIAAQEQLTETVEKTTEARLKLVPKKDGSGEYTAMDGKYEIGQDADGWKVFQRDNAGLLNLIGTYEHFEDVKNDVSLLTREEIVRTDEVIEQIKILQEAYQSLRTETGGYMPLVSKYIEVLGEVKNGAMSAADAIAKLNEVIDNSGLAGVKTKPKSGTLEHLVDSLAKLDLISADPLNEIVRSIVSGEATISSEVQEILKSLNLLNEAGQFSGNYITEGMNNSGVITNDKYAIIARTQDHYDEPESYEYDFKEGTTYIENLIAKEKEAAEQGVNLARVLQRVKSETANGEGLFYEIQEFASGEQLHVFDEDKKNIQNFEQECARIVGASSEYIQKLMSDIIKLNELGFYIDFSPANILYDAAEGFKFIDLGLRDVGTSAQTVTELMEGLFDCLMDFGDSKERMKSSMEDAIKWSIPMMSVHNKLAAVFGENNFGADIGAITAKFSGDFAKYVGQANQKVLDTESKLTPAIEENADAKKKQVEQANALLEAEKQVTAEFEKQQDIIQQVVFEGIDEIGYISPYSSEQISQLTDSAKLDKIFKRFGVAKEDRSQITDKFNQWASMIAEQTEYERKGIEPVDDLPAMIDATMSEIVDMIMKLGSTRQPIEKKLESFYEYAKGIKVQYDVSDIAEFGDSWPETLRAFGRGRYGVLTQDKSAKTINQRWSELLELFPNLFSSSTINEKDQLKEFIRVLRAARDEHKNKAKTAPADLPDYAFDNIMFDLSGSYHTIESNTDKMLDELDAAVQKENMFANAAERASNAIKGQSGYVQNISESLSDVSVEEIVNREINSALEQLRSAKDNETTLFSLKGVFDGEELVQQARNMIDNIAEQANLSLASFNVKDDTIRVKLYNDELKVTVDQIYKLKAATEEMESSQLQLVSQSFSQNVKALNENNFDVEGMQARALAAIEKTRSSLHGLEYDLTDLETAAKNISSQDDFNKFNNQLRAAQDNIQAIKNSTVSKNSMNPLANMQRDMQNANIEIETMRLKLEKFGDIKGVSEAKEMLLEMAKSANKYNEATNAQEQQTAYNQYSNLRSSFKAQTEYINAAKALNDSQQSTQKQTDPIREQYQSILDLVNKINAKSSEITKYQAKDGGSGLFGPHIKNLQLEKEKLVAELKNVLNEIDNTFTAFVPGKEVSVPFASFLDGSETITNFLNDTRVQASLTTEEIDKLVNSLQKSQNIDAEAAAKVTEQFKSVKETYDKLSNLEGLDQNNESYQALVGVFKQIMQYKDKLSADPTSWSPEESAHLQTLIEQFTKYGNALAAAGEKEARYFANKTKYTQGTKFGGALDNVSEETKKVDNIRKQLEDAAKSFAKDSGVGDAFITKFSQSADGISKLDFSVFDNATGSLRNFSMEMGNVTKGMYVTENTISKSLANIKAAQKQLESTGNLIGTLNASGVNTKGDGSASAQVQHLLSVYKQLSAEISKGDGADQSMIAKLTKDLKFASVETEKLYKQMIQMDNAIASGQVTDLGQGNVNGNVYNQLVDATKQLLGANKNATVEIGSFDAATNSLNASLIHANGTVENFKVSMNGLSGQMTAQQTGVNKLTSTWDRFKSTMAGAGKQLMTAFAGYNVFYKAIAEVRKGIGYVKEIDLALTELKKVTDETEESYAQFLNTAASSAGKIGSTVSDFTEATSNFARLGYTMEESANMAETAIVYKNVADGLDTVEAATDSIISTMKANANAFYVQKCA